MKLGYVVIYVPNVAESVDFYCRAFGFVPRFVHEAGDYTELESGETVIALASHTLGESNLPRGYIKASESAHPLGMELGLVTDNLLEAHARALACGAEALMPPTQMPWGWSMSYVRCPDGSLIELCSEQGINP